MLSQLTRVFGRQTSGPAKSQHRSSPRAHLQVESLEERQVLSHVMEVGNSEFLASAVLQGSSLPDVGPGFIQLDMTTVAKQFPPHAGPTTLFMNFDGFSYDVFGHTVPYVDAFVSTTGNRDSDIQEILFRTSEMFAPFNVNVRRIFGAGNYAQNSGNTTIFIGDYMGITNTGGSTPSDFTDAPIGWRSENHQPNSDSWDYAYVDPIHNANPANNYDNQRIAKVAAHEAGHTFGLIHTRTVGQDPTALNSLSSNPQEVMAYDSSSAYEYFRNSTYNITIYNRSSNGVDTYLEEDLKATWYGETISRQNSYTYLQAVLGARPGDDAASVVHRDYTNRRAAVDTSFVDSPSPSVAPGSVLNGTISRIGDYDVYQLGATSGVNWSLSIHATPVTGSNVDTALMVFDNLDGRLVAYNSSAADKSSQIIFRRDPGHTYQVVVGAVDGASTGMFRLSVANVLPLPLGLGGLSTAATTTTTSRTSSTAESTTALSGSLLGARADENDGARTVAAALSTRDGAFPGAAPMSNSLSAWGSSGQGTDLRAGFADNNFVFSPQTILVSNTAHESSARRVSSLLTCGRKTPEAAYLRTKVLDRLFASCDSATPESGLLPLDATIVDQLVRSRSTK